MSLERRDAMLEAVEGASDFHRLRDVVKSYVDAGVDLEAVFEDLEQIHPLLPEREEDLVLDVMDLVVGNCAPQYRIGPYPPGHPDSPFTHRWRVVPEPPGPAVVARREPLLSAVRGATQSDRLKEVAMAYLDNGGDCALLLEDLTGMYSLLTSDEMAIVEAVREQFLDRCIPRSEQHGSRRLPPGPAAPEDLSTINERRDAMLEAVEGAENHHALRDVVKAYTAAGVDIQVLFDDLEHVRALVPDQQAGLVLEVRDLVIGFCPSEKRIGPYTYDDPRNPFRQGTSPGSPGDRRLDD